MAKNNLKALIFDLDGTLVDSEPNYFKADREFIESYGGEYSRKRYQSFIGAGSINLINWLKETYHVQEPLEKLMKEKDQLYRKHARKNTTVFPEMLQLLKTAKTFKLPMAVASGSTTEVIQEILEITELKNYFQFTLSAEKVERGKPEPDVFIETARQINVRPEECIVFEDSLYGLMAGLKASMKVVFIPSVPDTNNPEFQKAHCLYPQGMKDFSSKHCWSWILENFTL